MIDLGHVTRYEKRERRKRPQNHGNPKTKVRGREMAPEATDERGKRHAGGCDALVLPSALSPHSSCQRISDRPSSALSFIMQRIP